MRLFNSKSSKAVLRDYIEALPKRGRGEITRIAAHLRVSTTLVSQVLAGRKSFTMEQTKALVSFLGLSELEADYLLTLVLAERAGTAELRKYWEKKLEDLREKSRNVGSRVEADRQLTDTERAVFYSSALFSSVRLFTSTGKNGKTLEEICARFELSRAKASAIVQFLLATGLCREEKGRYQLGAQKTHLPADSPFLLRHHGNWRLRALASGESLGAEELMYTAPVSLSREDFATLREEMVLFIKAFLGRVHASPAEEIACFNMDFFWIRK